MPYSYDRTKIARTYNLEEMAKDLVGDSKSPNMFFLTNSDGKVIALVATTKTDAVRVATTLGAYLVEDRKHGEVWGSPEYEKAQEIEE